MDLKPTENRRKNLSKFVYDLAKVTFGGVAVVSVVREEPVDAKLLLLGLVATAVLIVIGYLLDN